MHSALPRSSVMARFTYVHVDNRKRRGRQYFREEIVVTGEHSGMSYKSAFVCFPYSNNVFRGNFVEVSHVNHTDYLSEILSSNITYAC